VVQAGDTVSFSFGFQFERDEVLLATQAEISAPHLSDFQFANSSGISGPNPWDLTSTFRRRGPDADGRWLNPMWVHAENVYGGDPMGVTSDEVGGLAQVGSFSAIATYNGEVVFDLSEWSFLLLDGFSSEVGAIHRSVSLDPTWAHLRTGVTIVGGVDLPSPPPPPAAPEDTPVVQQPPVAPPVDVGPSPRSMDGPGILGVRSVMPRSIASICREGGHGLTRMRCRGGDVSAFHPDLEDGTQLSASVYIGSFNVNVAEPAFPLLALLMAGLLALIRRR
jgi:hypothetical protein